MYSFAQISKILHPKKNAPKYFTENDLANDLAHWFNNILSKNEKEFNLNIIYGKDTSVDTIVSICKKYLPFLKTEKALPNLRPDLAD